MPRFPASLVARIYRANLVGSWSRSLNRRERSIAIAPGYVYPGLVPTIDMGCGPVRVLRAIRTIRSN